MCIDIPVGFHFCKQCFFCSLSVLLLFPFLFLFCPPGLPTRPLPRYQCLCSPQKSYADLKPVTPYGRCTVGNIPEMSVLPGTIRYYGHKYVNNSEWQYRSKLRASGVPWCKVEPESCNMCVCTCGFLVSQPNIYPFVCLLSRHICCRFLG